jgi:hypothetical protein
MQVHDITQFNARVAMNLKRTSILAVGLFVGTAFATKAWMIGEDGVGPARIGMTLAHLSAALHEKLIEEEPGGSENCFYVHAPGHNDPSFMIIDGRLVRVDIGAPGISTSSGIQVGDSEAKVRESYGPRVKVTAHTYVDTGNYLTVRSADGRYGVRFVTDKGKITEIYAGTYEAIQYVEGCE